MYKNLNIKFQPHILHHPQNSGKGTAKQGLSKLCNKTALNSWATSNYHDVHANCNFKDHGPQQAPKPRLDSISTHPFQLGELGTKKEFRRKSDQAYLFSLMEFFWPLPWLYSVLDHPCGYTHLIESLPGDWRQATATSKALKTKYSWVLCKSPVPFRTSISWKGTPKFSLLCSGFRLGREAASIIN